VLDSLRLFSEKENTRFAERRGFSCLIADPEFFKGDCEKRFPGLL